MPKLPEKKVGIVACSGEEMAEGTVTRLAALRVLEELRPEETVTICLPLFLAGGEGDRAFARFYPTIAVDGCQLRCAARATERYSSRPAASIVVSEIVAEEEIGQLAGLRRLNEAGRRAVDATAGRIAEQVDRLLGKKWSRREGRFVEPEPLSLDVQPQGASCACGGAIPVQTLEISGEPLTFIALPAIFEQFHEAGRRPSPDTAAGLLAQVKIYNTVPSALEAACEAAVAEAYAAFWEARRETGRKAA